MRRLDVAREIMLKTCCFWAGCKPSRIQGVNDFRDLLIANTRSIEADKVGFVHCVPFLGEITRDFLLTDSSGREHVFECEGDQAKIVERRSCLCIACTEGQLSR